MFKADWSLPEPTQDKYSESLLSGATSFGDTAVVTIAPLGRRGLRPASRRERGDLELPLLQLHQQLR